jgi:hypothetical protein
VFLASHIFQRMVRIIVDHSEVGSYGESGELHMLAMLWVCV